MNLRRLARFLRAGGLGVVAIVGGLGWDASLHAGDHTLAAREGVLSLGNPAHLLFLAGVFVASLGVAGAIATLARAFPRVPRGLRSPRARGFAFGVAVGVALAGGIPAALSAARGLRPAAGGEEALLHAASAAGEVKPMGAHGGPMGTVDGGYGDGTFPADFRVEGGVKVFNLRAAPIDWAVEPGVVKKAYAFNRVIPGPVIKVNEGDRVRLVVENALPVPTSVHWHGMILPNEQDGVPGLTQPAIEPGTTYTYEFTAVATGTHWYHSHMGGREIGRGLYGAFEVVPKLGEIQSDHDYHLFVGDTDLGLVLNGRSFPNTIPLQTKLGERVRLRLFNAGDMLHPIHLHGFPFKVLAQDGLPLASPPKMDTLVISPGQTFDLLIVPETPGRWLLHCHIFSHSEGEDGMTGLVTTLDVSGSKGTLGLPLDLPKLPIPLPELPLPGLLPQLPGQSAPVPEALVAPVQEAPGARPAVPDTPSPGAAVPAPDAAELLAPMQELLRRLSLGAGDPYP